MSETKINGALVSAYLASDLYPLSRTNVEGKTYTPVTGQAWARLTDMPTGREPAAFGAVNPVERSGYLQIDVFHPNNTGTGPILADADKALSFYRPGLDLEYQGQRVHIRKAERSKITPEAVWTGVSIKVFYTAWIFPTA
ncbi:phage tail terminator-like protein [Pseudomonas sp. G.S.17]|uniref:phage tail terminator-like protein n=1 Tax=Pseudomonas sp. G.S.17 TaxID=3137451 RepID=UPI00311CA514